MNHIYRLVWSSAQNAWVVCSELTKAHKKSASIGSGQQTSALRKSAVAVAVLSALSGGALAADNELPTGGQILSGAGDISQSGNLLNIQQNSHVLDTQWNSFNVGSDASVRFQQPDSSAIAINRIQDNNPSNIRGRLEANGQVFLQNPNGILFGESASINAGGLIATTQSITAAGQDRFAVTGDSNGTVSNAGQINIAEGGTIALIAPQVNNSGSLTAPRGNVRLTAAEDVTLQLNDGTLAGYNVNKGVLDGLVDNSGSISANGGVIHLDAKARDDIGKAVVNHSGAIEANTISRNEKGEIILLGDMAHGSTNVSGSIRAEGKGDLDGGFIETSAAKINIADSAEISTQSELGTVGQWLLDPADIYIAADTDPKSNITGTALTTALGNNDVTIATATPSCTGANCDDLSKNAGPGNIFVNDTVTWSANTLTLTADKDVVINKEMQGSGNAKLTVNTGTGGKFTPKAPVNLGNGDNFTFNGDTFTVISDLGSISGNGKYALGQNLPSVGSHTPISGFKGKFNGLGHTISGVTINTSSKAGLFSTLENNAEVANLTLAQFDVQNSRERVGALAGETAGNTKIDDVHVIDSDIKGGRKYAGGLIGKMYDNSTVSRSSFGGNGKVTGDGHTGGLIGVMEGNGTVVTDSYVDGNVTIIGATRRDEVAVGGLVGTMEGGRSTIRNSYARTAKVGLLSGRKRGVGGLVGAIEEDQSTIENSYAITQELDAKSGASGGLLVGALYKARRPMTITNTYASGSITGGATKTGGLVGNSSSRLTVTNSYWDSTTSGQTTGCFYGSCGEAKTTDELKQAATFSGWDIATTGGTDKVWRIYEGHTMPLLRSFLTPAKILDETPQDYTGTKINFGPNPILVSSGKVQGGALPSKEVGPNANTYNETIDISQYWSDQHGFDLDGNVSLVINPAVISKVDITAVNGITASDKVYDGTTTATLDKSSATFTGIQAADTGKVNVDTAVGNFVDKNVGSNKTVNITGITLGGVSAGNYRLTKTTATTTASITPKDLTIEGINKANNKVYDTTKDATLDVGTLSIRTADLVGSDVVNLPATLTGEFDNKNVGTGKAVTIKAGQLTGADAGNYKAVPASALSAEITKAPITDIAGITPRNKPYDGNTNAQLDGVSSAVITGKLGTDDLKIRSAVGTFDTADIGTGKAVVINQFTFEGADAGNYELTPATFAINETADITAASSSGSSSSGSSSHSAGGNGSVGHGSGQGSGSAQGGSNSGNQGGNTAGGSTTTTPTTDNSGNNNQGSSHNTGSGGNVGHDAVGRLCFVGKDGSSPQCVNL